MLALHLGKLGGYLGCLGKGSAKKSHEIFNYVVLKVTNVHQVKVNDHDESEWYTRSSSVCGLLHRVNIFVINFNFIYFSPNKLF